MLGMGESVLSGLGSKDSSVVFPPTEDSGRPAQGIRSRRVIVILVAVAFVAASAGVGAYLWNRFQNQPATPTRYYGLSVLPETAINVSNSSNGPGGCAGPGLGLTEYCFICVLDEFAMVGVTGPGAHAETIVYETTADTTFLLLSGPGGTNVTYENVTLLGSSGLILATYTAEAHWSSYGGDSLPIILSGAETMVLNIGTSPAASGDYIWFEQGAWGTSGSQLS
jgi:hypothetical protein